jgi:mannose-6-phosphate isomerase-like protein (cupin superfamily)
MTQPGNDASDAAAPRYLIDTYLDFIHAENVPIAEAFGIDLLHVDTRPWARMGNVSGAYALTSGRGDFLDMYVLDIPPAASTDPQKHLYEEVIYVLDGRGSTTVHAADGSRHSFEWGPKSVFAIPLNVRYQHFNGSGQRAARLAGVTNLPLVLNAFHNEDFVFKNDFVFPERLGIEKYFEGDGTFIPTRPGRHMWETNFVPDLSSFKLWEWQARGAGGSNIMFVLAGGTMHAHMSEMPVGTYKKAHRHGPDFHVFAVTGHGYSIYWYEGDDDFQRFDWQHGCVFAPADRMFHQHFNTSQEPARYIAIAFGSIRYPFAEDKKKTFLGMDVSIKDGGRQVEYEDQDPRIHRMYVEELTKYGIEPHMDQFLTRASR